jgi:hypothetical protein
LTSQDVGTESRDVEVFVEKWAFQPREKRRLYALAVLGAMVFTSTCNEEASSFLTQVYGMVERWSAGTIHHTEISLFYAWTHVLLINCSYTIATPCIRKYTECIGRACLELARVINKGEDKFLRTYVEIALESIWCYLLTTQPESENNGDAVEFCTSLLERVVRLFTTKDGFTIKTTTNAYLATPGKKPTAGYVAHTGLLFMCAALYLRGAAARTMSGLLMERASRISNCSTLIACLLHASKGDAHTNALVLQPLIRLTTSSEQILAGMIKKDVDRCIQELEACATDTKAIAWSALAQDLWSDYDDGQEKRDVLATAMR